MYPAALLLIAAGFFLIVYQLRRGKSAPLEPFIYEHRLAVYRETVRLLTTLSLNGDISQDELSAFRANTHESFFLFGRDIADYIDQIYARSTKLRSTNALLKGTELRVGEQRDKVTVENSAQLIWLADQLALVQKKFEKYLTL